MVETEENIVVSITCNAYNHEDYIEKALEGFIKQKTDFKFEVLIHDDASTDKTADIIRKYEKNYPEIIKPIYQTQNQYSQGNSIFLNYQYPRIKGKYVAVCEGDDFWIDEYKLQKQVDFMEKNPEYSLCAHSALRVDHNGIECDKPFRSFSETRQVTTEECIYNWMFPTNSILYRKKLREPIIPFAKGAPCGDYPLVVYMALKGKVMYFDESMSAYRVFSRNSVTDVNRNNVDKRIEFNEKFIKMLDNLEEYTNGAYSNAIQYFRNAKEVCLLADKKQYFKLMNPKYKEWFNYKSFSIKHKIKIWCYILFPKLMKKYDNYRKKSKESKRWEK